MKDHKTKLDHKERVRKRREEKLKRKKKKEQELYDLTFNYKNYGTQTD